MADRHFYGTSQMLHAFILELERAGDGYCVVAFEGGFEPSAIVDS